jgi:hypothetical protein
MRLPTKPSQTPDQHGDLADLLGDLHRVASTDRAVLSPRTTSSSFMTLAGEKKCMPITPRGRLVAAAISSMFSAEVLVARIAPGLAMASSLANTPS